MSNQEEVIERLIDEARSLADPLPERYQASAFQVVLSYLLDRRDATQRESDPVSTPVPGNGHGFDHTDTPGSITVPDPHLIKLRGSRQQQTVWAALALTQEDEAVNNDTVRATIRARLGIQSESRKNTAGTLQKLTPKYLSRSKNGRGYSYLPTPRATEIFDGFEQ